MRLKQRRHSSWNSRQYRVLLRRPRRFSAPISQSLSLLFGFDGFPVAQHLRRSVRLHITKYVRMPVNELVRQSVKHVIDREMFLLVGHLRVEEHLQQEVSELARKLIPVAIVDRLQNFVRLFERVWLYGIEGLLPVPRASARRPQTCHDRNRAFETISRISHRQQSK